MSNMKAYTDINQSKKLIEINISRIMKKIILLIFTALMMVGCDFKNQDGSYNTSRSISYSTIVIDSCEYIEGYYSFAHKGNCKYCKERRKQELKELVEQLKKK